MLLLLLFLWENKTYKKNYRNFRKKKNHLTHKKDIFPGYFVLKKVHLSHFTMTLAIGNC